MDVFTILDQVSLQSVVKVLLIILLLVYSLFAMLMMRQIAAMTKAVHMADDYVIRGLGVLHFIFAMVVLMLALFVST